VAISYTISKDVATLFAASYSLALGWATPYHINVGLIGH